MRERYCSFVVGVVALAVFGRPSHRILNSEQILCACLMGRHHGVTYTTRSTIRNIQSCTDASCSGETCVPAHQTTIPVRTINVVKNIMVWYGTIVVSYACLKTHKCQNKEDVCDTGIGVDAPTWKCVECRPRALCYPTTME